MLRDGKKCSENVFIILPLFRSLAHLPHSTIIQCVVCLRNFILIFVILCKYFFISSSSSSFVVVVVFFLVLWRCFSSVIFLSFGLFIFYLFISYILFSSHFFHSLGYLFQFVAATRCSNFMWWKKLLAAHWDTDRPRERGRARESLLELRTCTWEMRVDWFRRILKSTHSRMQRTNKNIFRKCIFGIVSRRMTELNKLIQLTK